MNKPLNNIKNFASLLAETTKHLKPNTPVEIWFQDEARVGQKNGVVYQWAKKGTRPRQPKDQRYASCYIFGAVCPARNVGAALVMPYADTEAMQKHLDEISKNVAPKAHAVILMPLDDCWQSSAGNRRSGVAQSGRSQYPEKHVSHVHSTLFARTQSCRKYLAVPASDLPFKSGVEDYDNIVDACCKAWNSLIGETGSITSIASKKGAINGQ